MGTKEGLKKQKAAAVARARKLKAKFRHERRKQRDIDKRGTKSVA